MAHIYCCLLTVNLNAVIPYDRSVRWFGIVCCISKLILVCFVCLFVG